MFQALANRFSSAKKYWQVGALMEAFEIIIFGDFEDDPSVDTQKPIVKSADFFDLIKQIGLDLPESDFTPGDHVKYDLGDQDKYTLHIDTSDRAPQCSLFLSGRTINAYISIRQNPETELYQIDMALISLVDAFNEDFEQPFQVPTDVELIGSDLLPQFLKAFGECANLAIHDDWSVTPQEAESMLTKRLNPIIRRICEIEVEAEALLDQQKETPNPTLTRTPNSF